MKFSVEKGSDINFHAEVNIYTLEELKNYVLSFKHVNEGCVIYWDTMTLVIYDSWIE